MMIGIAAGVAACVVIGLISKRTGILDSLIDKIKDLRNTVEDKLAENAGMQDIIPKGEEKNVASNLASKN